MSKILYFLISFVLVLSLAGNVLAYETYIWDNDFGDGNRMWDTASNWDGPGKIDTLPKPDTGWVELSNYGDANNGPIINDDMNAVTLWVDYGYYDGGNEVILTMTGGSFTMGDAFRMGYYQAGYYRFDLSGGTADIAYMYIGHDDFIEPPPDFGYNTLNMSGGTLNTLGYLDVGTGRGHQADINMTGGTINVGKWFKSGFFGVEDWFNEGGWFEIGSYDVNTGKGHVGLHGGTIEADYLTMGGGGVGTMDFAYDGTLIIDGDYRLPNGWLFDPCTDTPITPIGDDAPGYTGTIPILVQRGLITAYGTNVGDIITDSNFSSAAGLRAVINLDYDVTNPGQTTITGEAVDPNLAWDPDPLNYSAASKVDVNRISWAAGPDSNSHDVYFGTDFNDVNDATIDVNLGVYEGNQPLADVNYPVSVDWNTTYYWRIDEVNNPTWKGTVWNFTIIPAWATNHRPTGTTLVSPLSPVLRWDNGPVVAATAGHYVYFSTDFNDVNDRIPDPCILDTNTYAPGDLELDTKYYWAVDEFNDNEDPNIWLSQVWNFTTTAYLNADNFNPYADTDALQAVWTIAHLQNQGAELQIETRRPSHVRDANSIKSMLFAYRNKKIGGQYRGSEANAVTTDLFAGSNWVYSGVEVLVLYFQGDPCNAQEWLAEPTIPYHILNDQMYVALEDGDAVVGSGIVKYDTEHGYDMNDVTKTTWQEWNIDLADPCLADVNMANVAKVYIGFGGLKTGQSGSGAGEKSGNFDTVWFDDIRAWPPRCVPKKVVHDIDGNDCKTDYNDVNAMGRDWLMYDYNVAAVAISSPPVGWWPLDEGKYATTADISGYGNDGSIFNEDWVDGHPGDPEALHFDGDGIAFYDRVICAERDGNNPGTYPAELMPATFTVACWAKIDSFDYFEGLVANGTDYNPDRCGFYLYSAGFTSPGDESIGLMICTEEGISFVETASIYKPNIWYHFAATYNDANMVYLYVDGKRVPCGLARSYGSTGYYPKSLDPTDVGGPIKWISDDGNNYPQSFSIGAIPVGELAWNQFDFWGQATIDDVRVYDYAMPYGEIVTLAEQGPVLYHYLASPANISDDEPKTSKIVNFRDYRMMADHWLEDPILWPW